MILFCDLQCVPSGLIMIERNDDESLGFAEPDRVDKKRPIRFLNTFWARSSTSDSRLVTRRHKLSYTFWGGNPSPAEPFLLAETLARHSAVSEAGYFC